MSTEQYASIEQLVRARSPLWERRIGLSHFSIEHVFLDSFFGDDGEEDFKVTACTESRWNYLQAKVKWYLPSVVRHSVETIERTLVHELCHVLLSPEQYLLDDQLESTGDGLTKAEQTVLQKLYYERMELATEMTARALWLAWSTPGYISTDASLSDEEAEKIRERWRAQRG